MKIVVAIGELRRIVRITTGSTARAALAASVRSGRDR